MALDLVSEQSEETLRQARLEQELRSRLRVCAANFLRIVAGAGRPETLSKEMAEVVLAFEEMREARLRDQATAIVSGTLDVEEAARVSVDALPEDVRTLWDRNGERAQIWARERLRKASLRLAAAELAGQLTHQRSAEMEILHGVSDYLESRKQKRQFKASGAE